MTDALEKVAVNDLIFHAIIRNADDICCATQVRSTVEIENVLTCDLIIVTDYCKRWRLPLSVTKTMSSIFLLHYAKVHQELKIMMDQVPVQYELTPVYLGVPLDRILSFKDHIKNAAKVKIRTSKLAGTS